jgi:hypothetical protein
MCVCVCVCTYMYIYSLYVCIGHIRYVNVNKTIVTRSVSSHCDLAIYIKKHLKPKEEVCKFKHFIMQKYNLKKKIPLKEPKTLQDIITL